MYDDSAAHIYIRCLKLMYVPRAEFVRTTCWVLSGVQDALEILRVAAQLLFHDCIDACMEYLEMLPSWTPSEEASIKSVLSSLQLPRVHPDLARRMNIHNHVSSSMESSLLIMRRMLLHVLQESYKGVKSTRAPRHQNIDPSRPIPESMVLEAWNANMDLVKEKFKRSLDSKHVYYLDRKESTWNDVKSAISTLSWMFSSLKALHVGDIVMDTFSKDDTLSSLLVGFGQIWSSDRKSTECFGALIYLLKSMMKDIQNGYVLLPRQSRLAFITTWLPAMQAIYPSQASKFMSNDLSSDFKALINTLPLFDREKFFKDYMKSPDGVDEFFSLNSSFATWCNSLRESIIIGQAQDLLLVDSS